MKKILLLAVMLFGVIGLTMAQGDSTAIFKVYGNCESCKARIEKAAKAAGATEANWNEETKLIEVTFKPSKTSSDKIQMKIASVGHDTEKYQSLESAYTKLPGCCKYERNNPLEKH